MLFQGVFYVIQPGREPVPGRHNPVSTSRFLPGLNVVFHEFAHQIDSAGGKGDDSTVLKDTSSYIAWARVLQKDYEKLRQAAERNSPAFLNKYGAVDPAEFFAVATEFFFEKPKELKQIHPDLYNELKKFYHQDPAEFIHLEAI